MPFSGEMYAKVFDVTKKEIKTYLKDKYQLSDLAISALSNRDGIYIIPIKKGFYVFEQERNIKFLEKKVGSIDEAWDLYVDYLVRTSGTGLDLE